MEIHFIVAILITYNVSLINTVFHGDSNSFMYFFILILTSLVFFVTVRVALTTLGSDF